MLVGSRSQEVLAARLDELSTYGILRSYGAAYVTELFRELLRTGCIQKSPGQYPVMSLTQKGAKIMFGKESSCKLNWPSVSKIAPEPDPNLIENPGGETGIDGVELGFDQELFNKLTLLRSKLARENGVPAYTVFHTSTLEFFTRLKPKSEEAGRRIRGVGPVNARSTSNNFLSALRLMRLRNSHRTVIGFKVPWHQEPVIERVVLD